MGWQSAPRPAFQSRRRHPPVRGDCGRRSPPERRRRGSWRSRGILHGSAPRVPCRALAGDGSVRVPLSVALGCEVETGGCRDQRHEGTDDHAEFLDVVDGDDIEQHHGRQCVDVERQQRDEQVRDSAARLVVQRPRIGCDPVLGRGRKTSQSIARWLRLGGQHG